MTIAPPIEERRSLQKELHELRQQLKTLRKTRELARRTGIHPSTVQLYLDGFGTDANVMRQLIAECKVILSES